MRIVLLNTIGEACGGFVKTYTVLKYKWKRNQYFLHQVGMRLTCITFVTEANSFFVIQTFIINK